MSEEKSKRIVIKIKRGRHEAHHGGGAWKVAYADFVTAMMALFIVLWLMNSNAKVKEAVAGYFRDPAGTGEKAGTATQHASRTPKDAQAPPRDDLENVKVDLEKMLKNMPEFQDIKNQITITITDEGLRVELLENAKGMFFELGSPKPSATGIDLLKHLAEELGKLPNRVLIEGHTDAQPFTRAGSYGNWELSADRANQARQIMQEAGLRSSQVAQVRGFADQQLRNAADPNDPANRRISVIVQYQKPPAAESKAASHALPANPSAAPSVSGLGE
jgi:chemotaxis protein MotB